MMPLKKTQKTLAGRRENDRGRKKVDGENARRQLDDRFYNHGLSEKKAWPKLKKKNINNIDQTKLSLPKHREVPLNLSKVDSYRHN